MLALFVTTTVLVAASEQQLQVFFSEDFADITSATGSQWVETKSGETEEYALATTFEDDGENKVLSPKFGGDNHFAIQAKFEPEGQLVAEVPSFTDSPPLVVQYDVTYNNPVTCGGSYIKLMSATDGTAAEDLTGDSKYTIMFGPDYCNLKPRIHFIFTLEYPNDPSRTMEVHCKQGNLSPSFFNDKKTHLLTLILNGDNSYIINVDNEEYSSGSIGDEADCAPLQPKEIKDPSDTKPTDWVEVATIADPEHVKPADWVTEETIPDPTATMPEDWIEDDDGEWEAPNIANPEYKVWDQKMVENPEYKGVWEQKTMPNPDYFHEANPFGKLKPIDGVAFELVVNDPGLELDNVYMVGGLGMSPVEAARQKANETWHVRRMQQDAAALAAQNSDWVGNLLTGNFDGTHVAAIVTAVIVLGAFLFWFCASGADDADDAEDKKEGAAAAEEKTEEKAEKKTDGEKKDE